VGFLDSIRNIFNKQIDPSATDLQEAVPADADSAASLSNAPDQTETHSDLQFFAEKVKAFDDPIGVDTSASDNLAANYDLSPEWSDGVAEAGGGLGNPIDEDLPAYDSPFEPQPELIGAEGTPEQTESIVAEELGDEAIATQVPSDPGATSQAPTAGEEELDLTAEDDDSSAASIGALKTIVSAQTDYTYDRDAGADDEDAASPDNLAEGGAPAERDTPNYFDGRLLTADDLSDEQPQEGTDAPEAETASPDAMAEGEHAPVAADETIPDTYSVSLNYEKSGDGPDSLTNGETDEAAMSSNNLKQLGLAAHSYSDVHKTMPPINDDEEPSTLVSTESDDTGEMVRMGDVDLEALDDADIDPDLEGLDDA
jgi:hypothetical protein